MGGWLSNPPPPPRWGWDNSGSLGFPKFWVGGSHNSTPPPVTRQIPGWGIELSGSTILLLQEGAADHLLTNWDRHLYGEGNDGAAELARQGRKGHPNDLLPMSKGRWVTEWDVLGVQPHGR